MCRERMCIEAWRGEGSRWDAERNVDTAPAETTRFRCDIYW